MQATAETRQRTLWATTAILFPLAFWIVFGIYDRLTTPPARRYDMSSDKLSREENLKFAKLRGESLARARQGKWKELIALLDEACGNDCPPWLATLEAEAHWRTGNRIKAAQLWEPTLRSESMRVGFLAIQGAQAPYQAYVTSLLAEGAQSSAQANEVAWAAVLLPQALEDYTPVVVLGERAVAGAERPEDHANALNTLGVALYRAGRYAEALTKLEESERAKPEMVNTVFIALCQHKLGQHQRAQSLADSYYNFVRDSLPVGSYNRIEYLLFEKELRATVPPSKKANPL